MAIINPKSKTKISRNSPEFVKEMKNLAKFRYFKNLANKEPSLPEMTRLLMKTNGWKTSIFELKTKPKKG